VLQINVQESTVYYLGFTALAFVKASHIRVIKHITKLNWTCLQEQSESTGTD